jgi:hypothetical protein
MAQGMKLFFGIFMVLVYLGMAVLMAINYFGFSETLLWRMVRWFFVVMFTAYGLYRGYREVKGEHSYGMRRYDDDEEQQYTTYGKRFNQIEDNNDDEKK